VETIVAESGGVKKRGGSGNDSDGDFPEARDKAGFIRYHLRALAGKNGGSVDGLAVDLFGRAFDFGKQNQDIGFRVLVDGEEAVG